MNNNKFNIMKLLPIVIIVLLSGMTFSSCNLLDLKPIEKIAPDEYYTTAEQLGGFTIGKYSAVFRNNHGWSAGRAIFDNGTDNQAAPDGNGGMFLQKHWRVPTEGGIGFNTIRDMNKFIKEVEAKYAAGEIDGNEALIKHYIGEAYVIRALLYYGKLRAYGDYPILDDDLVIEDDLVTPSRRMPRNEVARKILKDFDKGIALLQDNMDNKLRITKKSALVLKSRVALYEGTFELYHRGSGRVPGDDKWPGKDKEWNKGKTFDQASEVNFFLGEAMAASQKVADAIQLTTKNSGKINPEQGQFKDWNPYFEMFATTDLTKYPEVLLWQQYNSNIGVAHLTSNKLRTGSGTGWTRGLVESFLTKDGLPIYASGVSYNDETIDDMKQNRDERLQLFIFGESDNLGVENGQVTKFKAPVIFDINQNRDVTGYRQRKFYNYDPAMQLGSFADESGQIHVRVAEAYLNYIEASYVKNKTIDASARKYWTALRKRAGIEAPIQTTIDATKMSYEADVNRPSYDWGAFSAGKAVDATLYSIRRERRSEFCGEGFRMDDLKRWASLDQVKNYQIEGVNFWAKIYNYAKYKNKKGNSIVIANGTGKSNMSAKNLTTYLRPYQFNQKDELYDGYTFYQAHYLSPFSYEEMKLCSPTGDVKDSYLYQNIYWPTQPSGMAEK